MNEDKDREGLEAAKRILEQAVPETTTIHIDPNVKLKEQIRKAKENHQRLQENSNPSTPETGDQDE